jgi:glucose-1-phosphate thymidylyltransferase
LGAKVVRSRVIGPAVIGEGSVIEDSTIGPNVSVYFGCSVTGSRIEDSIVMEACTIAGVRGMTGSILGRRVEVRHAATQGMHRLVVGDQSRLEID